MARRKKKTIDLSALNNLAWTANSHHDKVCSRWTGMLDHARQAGIALNEAHSLCPHGKWQKWVQDNFKGSYETCQAYRRIASSWDDPRLQEARMSGVQLNSMKQVLDVLRDSVPKSLLNDDGTLNVRKAEADHLRRSIREDFANAIRNLHLSELTVFEECFDEVWKRFYERVLYPGVCQVLDLDLNEILVERYEAEHRYDPPPKPLKGMKRRDAVRLAERAAREDMRIPNIRYRQEKVQEEREQERRHRPRMRKASRKMTERKARTGKSSAGK